MSIITGVRQKAQTYQIMMKDNNNFTLNNNTTSNLINLNVDQYSYRDAIINFKNIYHLGIINDKMIFKYTSNNNNNNLLSIDNSNINFFKNINLSSNINININNLLITSNNKTTYLNSNVNINLFNNSDNYFKIVNNSSSLFELNKNNLNISTSTNFNNDVKLSPSSTLYTNFIDSPNNKPIVINNLSFAESLRILTNNVIHNISVDNSILWSNIRDSIISSTNADSQLSPINDQTWSLYMRNNNVNLNDIYFTKPNIGVLKYIGTSVGGSNILEFKTIPLNNNVNNSYDLIFSINNNGFINIGSNYTPNVPININFNPLTLNCSNIFRYVNRDNNNFITTINSNGYINIGSSNFTENQLNITKSFNSNLNNTELISLNINTTNFINYSNVYSVPFINNNDLNNFIFKPLIIAENASIGTNPILNTDIIKIIITNKFIENNIYSINANLYDNTTSGFYVISTDTKTVPNYDIGQIQTNIYVPLNLFKFYKNPSKLDYYLYPFSITPPTSTPDQTTLSNYNKIIINVSNNFDKNYIYNFYIFKNNNYIYNYNGNYIPLLTDYLKLNCNANNKFSVSANGNTGIGTNYNDIYKLYVPENALINNINCSTIDNVLTKNISFCNLNLNNINSLNCDTINNNIIIKSNSNISSNILVINNQIINNNLNVLNNINVSSNINISNNGIILNSNIILNNNNANIQIINRINPPNLILSNNNKRYDICINNNNNFQILLNNSTSIIEHKNDTINNNSISFIGSSFNIIRDITSNVKIVAGRSATINGEIADNWYNQISILGTTESYNTNKSLFYIYGNFYLNDPSKGNPMIHSYIYNENYLKLGIGTANNDIGNSNLMIVDMNTNFNSNISVNNNIYLRGTILSPSDINIKTDINIISSPLEKINKINGYTYKRTDTGNYETGLIAQEVLEILPEVVKYNNDIYNISYGNMCGILVEAIKELNNKIKVLESKSS
jgi:hypothetical protein